LQYLLPVGGLLLADEQHIGTLCTATFFVCRVETTLSVRFSQWDRRALAVIDRMTGAPLAGGQPQWMADRLGL
jgi:hypothetical protein